MTVIKTVQSTEINFKNGGAAYSFGIEQQLANIIRQKYPMLEVHTSENYFYQFTIKFVSTEAYSAFHELHCAAADLCCAAESFGLEVENY